MIRKSNYFLVLLLVGALLGGLAGCDSPPNDGPFAPVIVEVAGPGIIIVRESDLERMGTKFPATGGVSIWQDGRVIPAWQLELDDATQGRSIVFYAAGSSSRYSQKDIYQLVQASQPTPKLEPMPPGFGAAISPVKTWLRLEENHFYDPLSMDESYWLWTTLTEDAPFSQSFELTGTDATQEGEMILSVGKRGAVDEHRLGVILNDRPLDEVSWAGEAKTTITLPIPPGMLLEGENLLQIKLQGEETNQMVVDLDWIEIEYFQGEVADRESLLWQAVGDVQNIGGWQGLTISLPLGGGEGWISQAGPGGVVTYPTQPGTEFITADEAGWRYPSLLRPVHNTSSLERGFSGAEYVILSPPAWQAELEPLADFRRNEGLKTTIATLDAIYDRYSNGQVNPAAIRSYLQEALRKWETPPRYVLLVGDFSVDPQQMPGDGTYLPAFFVNTPFGGETVSDYPFALDENGQPALAVGRWPVNNRQELAGVLNSTIGEDRNRSENLHILGLVDPSEADFAQTQGVMERLIQPQTGASLKVSLDFQSNSLPTRGDYPVLMYIGHGSLTAWANPPLMNGDIFARNWSTPPVLILQFTCLSGYFVAPDQTSLSEEFLRAGVPVVMGPTSLTLPADQWPLMENWLLTLQQAEFGRVGDMLLNVWKRMADSPQALDVTQTFLLFGDPAYKVPWADKNE